MSTLRLRLCLRRAGWLSGIVAFCLANFISSVAEDHRSEDRSAKYLFICAGDHARTAPDFLAVVNFDEESADYGQVIATAPLPEPGATGNEFHHIGLSADGKVVACAGLLSVLKGQKEVFSAKCTPRAITKSMWPGSGSMIWFSIQGSIWTSILPSRPVRRDLTE